MADPSSPSAPPVITRAAITMVLADASLEDPSLPLPDIVDTLADTIRTELGDLTWSLHVVWDAGTTPSKPPREIPIPHASPDIGRFVHDWLVEFCADWGIAFDQVLIESSGVNPDGSRNAEMWAAIEGLDCRSSVHYLFADPSVWHDRVSTIAPQSTTVKPQPVALLEPLPEAHIVRNLLVELVGIITATRPMHDAEQWWATALATRRFRRWFRRWREVVSQIYGSDRHIPPAWPLEAVRLRFEDAPVAPLNAAGEASYGRWARAVTDRRVGVALGGAGAQSYVCLPFIAQLLDAGVPIDMLSGSSTGTFAAAFYAALGDRGLRRMLLNDDTIGWGVFAALVTNIPLTWWLAWGTDFIDLRELGQPVISASTIADSGETWYQTAGLAGKAMMASGSLPPFVATYIGDTRLLDGGLTDDLPTEILRTAGAKLVVAAQAIPKLMEIPSAPDRRPIPYPSKWVTVVSPLTRTVDYCRGYLMLFRQAARGSGQHAQVTYHATTRRSSAGSWYAGERIAREASNSPALKHAVAQAKLEWQALLDRPGGRVRINLATDEVEIGADVSLSFVTDPIGNWRLSAASEHVLAEVGRFVLANAVGLEVTLTDVPPPLPAEYEPLVRAASGLGSAQITYVTAPPGSGGPTFTLKISPEVVGLGEFVRGGTGG